MFWLVGKTLKFIWKLFWLLLILIGIIYLIFNFPVKRKQEKMPLGLTFSNVYARDLGLDWKKTYLEILDGLSFKKIRLVAYWTEIEKKEGIYDFSDLDWQIAEAKKRNKEVVLAFGVKVPRWPECFIPEFYLEDSAKREMSLLEYEQKLIERYKDNKTVVIWQIENEPFLAFGNCPAGAISTELLDKEINQTKKLDESRQIMVTDSGELSLWYQAASRGDIFGTTLYRELYNKKFGYLKYPVGPNFFVLKKKLIEKVVGQKNAIVIELQAEPWGPDWVTNLSIEEQYKTMNPDKLQEIIEFTKKTGLTESYLWGAEWWWWLKEKKNNDEMWKTAQVVFAENNLE